MKPLYPRLKKNEKERNTHSPCLLYTHDPEKPDPYPTSLPVFFPDLECCRARYDCIKNCREKNKDMLLCYDFIVFGVICT